MEELLCVEETASHGLCGGCVYQGSVRRSSVYHAAVYLQLQVESELAHELGRGIRIAHTNASGFPMLRCRSTRAWRVRCLVRLGQGGKAIFG